jgi:hypothetical protein
MKLTIKNPAPDDDSQQRWGDFHFGNALKRSLALKGIAVSQDFRPNWSVDHGEDVVLVLRGLSQFRPAKTKYNIIWIISHPAMVTSEELDAYDLVLTASAFHRSMLCEITRTPVEVARQCTDFGQMHLRRQTLSEEAKAREGIVYVANSRGQRREMARWIEETNIDVRVFGRAWEKFGVGHLVEKEYIANADLPELYRSAYLCLNDHWKDMRAFGFINNRVFDSLACGLPVLTDSFPEIRMLFGDALLYAHNAEEFKDRIAFCRSNYAEVLGRTREKWDEIANLYSFDARCDEIVNWIQSPPERAAKVYAPATGISQSDGIYRALREFVAQEEENTASLEKLLTHQTRLAGDARREAVWAKEKREEERQAKETFRQSAEKARKEAEKAGKEAEKAGREIKRMTERLTLQEQENNNLSAELKAVQKKLADLEIRFEKKQQNLSELENRLKKEERIRSHLVSYVELLRNQMDTIFRSRSWKIGAPYRVAARTVYGLLGGRKIGKARIPDWPEVLVDLRQSRDRAEKTEDAPNAAQEAAQKTQTGNFETPVFADQIFGAMVAGTEKMADHRPCSTRSHWRLRRLPGLLWYQLQWLILMFGRRLPDRHKRMLSGLRARVRGTKFGNGSMPESQDVSDGPIPALNRNTAEAASLSGAAGINEEIGYWHKRAAGLLRDLEAIRGDVSPHRLLLPEARKHNNLPDTDILSGLNEVADQNGSGSGPAEKLAYWRAQVQQLLEELAYAKAHSR